MADKKYITFIEKLIESTNSGKLSWKYLDSQQSFCANLKANHVYNYAFNTENSYYIKIKDTHTALIQYKSNPADLYVIPNTYKNVIPLSSEDYGEYITRLQNAVAAQFPSAESFIDNFLESDPTD